MQRLSTFDTMISSTTEKDVPPPQGFPSHSLIHSLLTHSLLTHSITHPFLLMHTCDFAVSRFWAFHNFKNVQCIWLRDFLLGRFLFVCVFVCLSFAVFCFDWIIYSCFDCLLCCVRLQHAPQQQQLIHDGGGGDPRRGCGKTGKHEEVEHQHLQGKQETDPCVMWLLQRRVK